MVATLYSKVVMWYKVSAQPVLLVISRDPEGKEKDDFFFTMDKGNDTKSGDSGES